MSVICSAQEYLDEIASLAAVYFDAVHGFKLVREWLTQTQAESSSKFGLTIAELDERNFIYGHGDPNTPSARAIVHTRQGEVKVRNDLGGVNTQFLGRMLLVSLYQLWEDHYRAEIAEEVGLSNKNALTSDLLGDMRRLRQAIVHNKGIGTSECQLNRILRWCGQGEPINPGKEQIKSMLFQLIEEIKAFADAD